MGEAKIIFSPVYEGYHNTNPDTKNRIEKSKTYQDLSTVCIMPCIGPIPPKIVQSIRGLMTPMNQKFTMVMTENMEVGAAYSETISAILQNPVFNTWKYILTWEHDNAPPPDGLLKLYENMDKYDGIGGLYWTKGEGGQPMCYDAETEVLTQAGWKFFKDVSLNDFIATLNNDGVIEYHKPSAKQEFFYEGKMIHWRGQSYDLKVTPDHSVYCSIRDRAFARMTASDIENKSKISWKRDGIWNGVEVDYYPISDDQSIKMDDWLEFLGYYISEGHCPKSSKKLIDIRQCKSDTYKVMLECIKKISSNTKERKGRIQFNDIKIREIVEPLGKSGEKYIPPYIFSLSKRQIKIFLNALWLGDGSWKNGRWENYYSKSKELADGVQELLLKVGIAGSQGRNRNNYVVSTSFSNLTPRVSNKPFREEYKGIVYDLTVPNHTLYIRRNGKVIWSGNCYGQTNKPIVDFIPFLPAENTVTPCRGIAMGFSLFKMDMFKDSRMPKPLFETKQSYTPGIGAQMYTQDLKFCEEAGKLGYKFAVDSRVRVGHYDYLGTAGIPDFFW